MTRKNVLIGLSLCWLSLIIFGMWRHYHAPQPTKTEYLVEAASNGFRIKIKGNNKQFVAFITSDAYKKESFHTEAGKQFFIRRTAKNEISFYKINAEWGSYHFSPANANGKKSAAAQKYDALADLFGKAANKLLTQEQMEELYKSVRQELGLKN